MTITIYSLQKDSPHRMQEGFSQAKKNADPHLHPTPDRVTSAVCAHTQVQGPGE